MAEKRKWSRVLKELQRMSQSFELRELKHCDVGAMTWVLSGVEELNSETHWGAAKPRE